MPSPKAVEFRKIFKDIVSELKKKFEYNLGFILNCADFFCWNLKQNNKEVAPDTLDRFSQAMKKLEVLQDITLKRVKDLSKTEPDSKNQQEMCNQMKQLNDMKQLFYFFPSLRAKRQEYIRDSLLLHQHDLLDQQSQWKVHDQLFLDNSTLRSSIQSLLKEKEYWESKLNTVIRISSKVFNLMEQDHTSLLRCGFHGIQKKRLSVLVRKNKSRVSRFFELDSPTTTTRPRKQSEKKVCVSEYPFSIENVTVETQFGWSPVLFQDNYQLSNSMSLSMNNISDIKRQVPLQSIYCRKKQTPCHLVVLVHKHSGSYRDMRLVRNMFGLILPQVVCLSLKTMTYSSTKCILEMAKDLANEVIHEIKKTDSITSISFICFSSGGVIARAALPYLQPFEKKMMTFISLETPHLGTNLDQGLFDKSSFMFWKGFKSTTIDDQLSLRDNEGDITDSLLFRLARENHLGWFRNIILFNCPQNFKTPCSSCLVEADPILLKSKHAQILKRMGHLFWKDITNDVVVRLNVFLDKDQR